MRTKPIFGKKEADSNQSPGCIWMLVLAVVGYWVFSAITRVTSGLGSRLDKIICYGTLAGFVIFLIFAAWQAGRDRAALEVEKQNWKNACRCAEVAILSRTYYPGSSYEDGYGIPHSSHASYRLVLEPNDDQRAVAPHIKQLGVDVYGPVYEKLENRNTVRIYYQPESPLTFLLEEEF
jgi:hypothetical protein